MYDVKFPNLSKGRVKRFKIDEIVPVSFNMHPIKIYDSEDTLIYAFGSLECAASTMLIMELHSHYVIDTKNQTRFSYLEIAKYCTKSKFRI